MNKQKSYHHPPTNPNYFSHTNYFFSVQLGHPKLSGYGLLSTQALQNRSQKYSSVSQSGATAFSLRDALYHPPPSYYITSNVQQVASDIRYYMSDATCYIVYFARSMVAAVVRHIVGRDNVPVALP